MIPLVVLLEIATYVVKRTGGECLPRGVVLDELLARHPDVAPEEVRAASLAIDRAPFPSIHGNPPVIRERPFYDARWLEIYRDRTAP